MSEDTLQHCWINGSLVSGAAATVPVNDHGLLYGDGIFEGIRFYHGRAFRLQAHLERLLDSAAALLLTVPWSLDELSLAVEGLIQNSGLQTGYLRLLVTRGPGPLGLDPFSCSRPNVIIILDRLAMVDEQRRQAGIEVVIAATRRLSADGLDPRIKSLNYLNHILARMEASRAGADEAILLNAAGRVAEGTADNVFIWRKGVLSTPPASDGALEGITRGLIMDLAREQGIEVREQSLTPYDLYTADECFLSGTGAELIPVRAVDGRPLQRCPGTLYERLERGFRHCIEQECEDTHRAR